MEDPRAVLGVGPEAGPADARRARRRLAKALHPDLHDAATRADAERRMALVNQAYDALVAEAASAPAPAAPPAPDVAPAFEENAFAIDHLPVEAFEAVLLAAVNLGDVIRTDAPYFLAVLLDDPGPCQCLLELVPDAGGTTVWIDVSPRHFGTCPAPNEVRDALAAEVGRVGFAN